MATTPAQALAGAADRLRRAQQAAKDVAATIAAEREAAQQATIATLGTEATQ